MLQLPQYDYTCIIKQQCVCVCVYVCGWVGALQVVANAESTNVNCLQTLR